MDFIDKYILCFERRQGSAWIIGYALEPLNLLVQMICVLAESLDIAQDSRSPHLGVQD